MKKNLNSPNAGWRNEPASARQWRVLRRIERETGHEFPASISRGEATEAISERFANNGLAARAHRRAERARKRAGRGGVTGRNSGCARHAAHSSGRSGAGA